MNRIVFNELNQQRLTGRAICESFFLYFGLECRVIFHFILVGHGGRPSSVSRFPLLRSRRRQGRKKKKKNGQALGADTGPPWRVK